MGAVCELYARSHTRTEGVDRITWTTRERWTQLKAFFQSRTTKTWSGNSSAVSCEPMASFCPTPLVPAASCTGSHSSQTTSPYLALAARVTKRRSMLPASTGRTSGTEIESGGGSSLIGACCTVAVYSK